MKAVILAAGLGSRLRPITNEVPKCMVPVNGIRIIDKQIDNLLINGVEEIYVVDGYKAEILANHLKERFNIQSAELVLLVTYYIAEGRRSND